MPVPVVSEEVVQHLLRELGYEPTEHKTATGTLWKHKQTGRHQQVPNSLDGFYPDFILQDLEEIIGKVNPWAAFKLKQRLLKKKKR